MNLIRQTIYRNLLSTTRISAINSNSLSSAIDIEKLEKESLEVEVDTEEAKIREQEIERKRNKSNLYSYHQNLVNDRLPHAQPKIWQHETIKYKRKMFGVYGSASGVNPSMCWPTQEELAEKTEYEKVAYPYTIQEVLVEDARKKEEEKEKIIKRQEDIKKKVAKLDQWINDLNSRIAKKESEARAAKERKERLVEEVRRHFGYKIDPREDKFKEMLEKKERAEKKLMKEAKKKAKQEKLIAKLKEGETTERKESAELAKEDGKD